MGDPIHTVHALGLARDLSVVDYGRGDITWCIRENRKIAGEVFEVPTYRDFRGLLG